MIYNFNKKLRLKEAKNQIMQMFFKKIQNDQFKFKNTQF